MSEEEAVTIIWTVVPNGTDSEGTGARNCRNIPEPKKLSSNKGDLHPGFTKHSRETVGLFRDARFFVQVIVMEDSSYSKRR